MINPFRNVSRIAFFTISVSLAFGIQINAQQSCPPWAQDRLKEIQQAVIEMVKNIGSPYSDNGAKIAQLYQSMAELPPVCLRSGSLGGYQNPNYNDYPRSIYQDGNNLYAPDLGIACDSTGCY